MLAALIPALAPVLSQVVGSLFPDPTARAQAEAQAMRGLIEHQQAIEAAAAGIIKAEAQSESWLARSWRPITMLTFTGLIVARWFGWAAPGLSEAEYLKLWSIVEFGLGGYVAGRTLEKIAPTVAGALRR